jgi:hypothetical protein
MSTPLPNDYYRHLKTGGLYTIVCIACEEATECPVVVYRSQQDHRTWTRPLEEFMDGRFQKVRPGGS